MDDGSCIFLQATNALYDAHARAAATAIEPRCPLQQCKHPPDARACVSQVPPQESNLSAEQLVPPQVPGRADGKRYPDPLQDGVDTTVHDVEPRWADASALLSKSS